MFVHVRVLLFIIQIKNKTKIFDCDDISVMLFCLEQDCFLGYKGSDTTRQMLGCCVILMQSLFLVMYKAMYVDVYYYYKVEYIK